MYLTSAKRPDRPASAVGTIGWIAGVEHGLPDGRVGILDVAAGGTAALAPVGAAERAAFVLAGQGVAVFDDGSEAAIEAEHALFVPRGRSLALSAATPLRVLVIAADLAGNAAPVPARVHMIACADLAMAPYHNPALGFHHVAARWLVDGEKAASRRMVVGQSEFAAGGAHLLHRHDNAAEFFCVLEGQGEHLVAGGQVAMRPGDIVFVPPGEWHGFRNTGGERVRAVFGYLGASSLEAGGYEVHPEVARG